MSHAESIRNAIAETYCCRSNTAAKLTQLDLDTFFCVLSSKNLFKTMCGHSQSNILHCIRQKNVEINPLA